MMFSNRFFAIALLVSFGGLLTSVETVNASQALTAAKGVQSDICVVDMEKLLVDLQKEIQTLQEKETANFQKEMEASNKKREALTAKKADMKEEEFNKQMSAIETEIQRKAQAAQARIQEAQQKAQKKAEETVTSLKDFAQKEGIKVLLPSQGVLYFDAACDVTAKAVKYVESTTKKPAAKPAATASKK